jgi:hypothetical protein
MNIYNEFYKYEKLESLQNYGMYCNSKSFFNDHECNI